MTQIVKSKKYNSEGDYLECECLIHSWNPSPRDIFTHFCIFIFNVIYPAGETSFKVKESQLIRQIRVIF